MKVNGRYIYLDDEQWENVLQAATAHKDAAYRISYTISPEVHAEIDKLMKNGLKRTSIKSICHLISQV